MNFYEVLGLNKDATQEEIKSKYRQLAFTYHPDKNHDEGAEARFKEINEAYQTLSDPQKRQQYNDVLEGKHGSDIFDSFFQGFDGNGASPFDAFFSNFGFGNLRKKREEEFPIHGQVNVSLRDVLMGKQEVMECNLSVDCKSCSGSGLETDKNGKVAEKPPTICSHCHGKGNFELKQGMFKTVIVCNQCRGKGKIVDNKCTVCKGAKRSTVKSSITVNVPPGVREGNTLELKTTLPDGSKAKANIMVHVEPHPMFELDNFGNIRGVIKLSYPTMILGGYYELELIDGTRIKLKIPEDTTPGKVIKIAEKGLPRSVSAQNHLGDMFLVVDMDIPTNLTDEQKACLKQFQELLDKVSKPN